MNLPKHYVSHLDHRITVLLSFTVRRESGFFGIDHGESKGLGDLYRSSMEGSGIMLRALLEFLGAKCAYDKNSGKPLGLMAAGNKDTRLGIGDLIGIPPLDISRVSGADSGRLAILHDEISKRTSHPAFMKVAAGLDPGELEWASEWITRELWERCYKPDPVVAHRDIVSLMPGASWKGILFRAS